MQIRQDVSQVVVLIQTAWNVTQQAIVSATDARQTSLWIALSNASIILAVFPIALPVEQVISVATASLATVSPAINSTATLSALVINSAMFALDPTFVALVKVPMFLTLLANVPLIVQHNPSAIVLNAPQNTSAPSVAQAIPSKLVEDTASLHALWAIVHIVPQAHLSAITA